MATTGTDRSVGAPALPVIGGNFSNSGPYANYVLVGTIAANPNRKNVEIINCTGAQIAVLLDDGTAATGAAPVNGTVFPLAAGQTPGPGLQGENWPSNVFQGRVQIFAPSALTGSAFVAAMED